ncbi:DUF3795 domain-containing protein [candidate division WOR-3 bacterium]|nr:DUF3795 domain-containing protein [candidate division WOR-3 bacterium]
MTEFRPDSYCGLYCGACDILSAFKKSLDTGQKAQWSELPKQFQSLPFDTKKSEIKCYGCKTDVVFDGCSHCLIRKCAAKKTGIETCLDCEKYPCWRHKLTGLVKKVFGLEKKLPHHKDIKPNLEFIRQNGIDKWLNEQEKKWTCPSCGERLTWYHPICEK